MRRSLSPSDNRNEEPSGAASNNSLTQDVGLSWDESNNMDLRQMIEEGDYCNTSTEKKRLKRSSSASFLALSPKPSPGIQTDESLAFLRHLQSKLQASPTLKVYTPPQHPAAYRSSTNNRKKKGPKVAPIPKPTAEADEFGDWNPGLDDLKQLEKIETDEFGPDFSLEEVSQLDTTTSVKPPKRERLSDEFGTLDMSLDDLDNIDSIIQQQQQQQQKPAAPTQPTNSYDDIPDDLPEIDFAALDRVVAEQQQQQQQNIQYLTFTRYKVLHVQEDVSTFTRTCAVALWNNEMLTEDDLKHNHIHRRMGGSTRLEKKDWPLAGHVNLQGEWYHTRVGAGDIIHVCSIQGQSLTSTLPLTLDTGRADDLVLIVHPDMLLTPTTISETVSCSRRAVIKNRLGSSGLTDKAPLFGTMRHELFEHVMKTRDFSIQSARDHLRLIVRSHAEDMLACGASTAECEHEVIRLVPQLQQFADAFMTKSAQSDRFVPLQNNGYGPSYAIHATSIESVEEPIISAELGLKGNVDMIVNARVKEDGIAGEVSSIVAVELKTGHNQKTQNAHLAQLALYSLMLRAKYGSKKDPRQSVAAAASCGMLLYMNGQSYRAAHVTPLLGEIKSLIGQRNVVAIESRRASEPRGIQLLYPKDDATKDAPRVQLLPPTATALPDLLPNDFSCSKCYANQECLMYERAALKADDSTIANHSHKTLLNKFTGQLTGADLTYFRKWDRLVDLEADAAKSLVATAWLISSSDREVQTGKCMSRMLFRGAETMGGVDTPGKKAVIELSRAPISGQSVKPLDALAIAKGGLVIISLDCISLGGPFAGETKIKKHMYIVRGYVRQITEHSVWVLAGEDDAQRLENVVKLNALSPTSVLFRVDADDGATGIGTLRQNLINLFTGDMADEKQKRDISYRVRLGKLRDSVVRLVAPSFDPEVSKTLFSPKQLCKVEGCDISSLGIEFAELNPDQRTAVERVFSANNYALIQGLPGTGKTSAIAFIVRLLVAHGKRVLITSYTHAAVDNVLMKLMDSGMSPSTIAGRSSVIRVGKTSSCHPTVQPLLAERVCSEGGFPTAESIKDVVSESRVVGVTALSAPRSPLLVGQNFDVVIVDESGQISQPAVLGALMTADTFVLVGDHMQLPPLVISEAAEQGGFGKSMLKRLADSYPAAVSPLSLQYRMHEDICQLSNDIIYGGTLKCANDSVRSQQLELKGFPENLGPSPREWLKSTVDPENAVTFVDTDLIRGDGSTGTGAMGVFHSLEGTRGGRNGGSTINNFEAKIVDALVGAFIDSGLDPSSIGVLCPYRAQVQLLDELPLIHQRRKEGLEVSTIDRYQGRDKPVILLSFVRSNAKGRAGRLLEDFRRLNVAITRAKYKLVMVGSLSTLSKGSQVLRPVLDRVRKRNAVIQIPDNGL